MFAALGIVLLIAGAVITFAVDRSVEGVDLAVIGWILMGGGALALLVAIVQAAGWKSSQTNQFHHERHVSSDGQHVVEETQAR